MMKPMSQTKPARGVEWEGDGEDFAPPKPRTPVVLALLAATAGTFSYLGAYAVTDALLAAEMMAPWPRESDPRPRWLVIGFASLMGLFLLLAGLFRHLSRRQLARIERMGDE